MAAAKKKTIKIGASSGHITNLKQSILETFNIYALNIGGSMDPGYSYDQLLGSKVKTTNSDSYHKIITWVAWAQFSTMLLTPNFSIWQTSHDMYLGTG